MWSTHEIHKNFATYVRYIIYTSSIAGFNDHTLQNSRQSQKVHHHHSPHIYMLNAYSAVGAAVNSTKSTKSIILKNLLKKIVRRKHIQYSFEFH